MKDLSPRAQRLLEVGRADLEPTGADQARIREVLRHRLPAVTPKEPAALPDAVHAGAAWPVISALTVGAGVLVGVVYLALSTDQLPETALPSSAQVDPVATTSSTIPLGGSPAASAELAAPDAPPAAESPGPLPPPPEPSRLQGAKPRDATRLGEEVDLLSRATSALHAGRASEALEILSEHQRRFPRGALSLERRAARAGALCQLGRKSEAERELQRLPASSPQAVRAREACAKD